MMVPLLLGLDPSKSRLGWALLNLESGAPVAAGTESLDVAGGGWLHAQVAEAFRAMKVAVNPLPIPGLLNYEVAVVCREEPWTHHVAQAKMHGAVCALVDAEVRRRWPHAPLWTLQPNEWKKLAGLPGNATKGLVASEARRIAIEHIRTRNSSGRWVFDPRRLDEWDSDQDRMDALLVARAAWRQWHEMETAA